MLCLDQEGKKESLTQKYTFRGKGSFVFVGVRFWLNGKVNIKPFTSLLPK